MTQNAVSVPATKNQNESMSRAQAAVSHMAAAIQGTAGIQTAPAQGAVPIDTRAPGSVGANVQGNPPPPVQTGESMITNPATNPAAALMNFDPSSVPANIPGNRQATPEEEKAANLLQEQSKKMQQSLKDMELSN